MKISIKFLPRVLHIQKVAGIAGSENHLLTLLPRLSDYGYEPMMLVLADRHDRPELFLEHMRQRGIPSEIMRMSGDVDPTLLARLVRFIRRGGFDMVHTHLLHADLYGRLAAWIARAIIVSTYHCDDPFHLIPGVRQMDRATALMCSQVICISRAVQNFVEKRIGIPPGRLDVVYYGLEPSPSVNGQRELLLSTLGIDSSAVVVGTVGRLTKQKGHSFLLRAIRLVLDVIPSVHLIIIGDGELRPALERLTAELGIEKNVHFIGYQPNGSTLIQTFDIFVLASLFEGLGLVLLEAMAAAKPIVASRVSAIPELVSDGKTGLLVPPGDPEALSNAVLTLIKDSDLARNLGLSGRGQLEQRFTVQKMVNKTVEVYRRALEN